MNTRQERKFNMFLAVKSYLAANASAVESLPKCMEYVTAFRDSLAQIEFHAEQQMFNKTGIAVSKKQHRDSLAALASDTSRRLTAYASCTNNLILLTEVKITESTLKKCNGNTLRNHAQALYDKAQANLAKLSAYGIDSTTQAALQEAINAFVALIPKPRLGIAIKKQSTTQLVTHFAAANDALRSIDTIVEIVKITQPDFYNGYKATRRVVNTGARSLLVKGTVTDAITGEPLRGATVNFCNGCTDDTAAAAANGIGSIAQEVVLTKVTARKGGFNIKSLPEGIYRVIVKKNGYREQVVTLAVTHGELNDLSVELTQN